jgi:hypothetical protein
LRDAGFSIGENMKESVNSQKRQLQTRAETALIVGAPLLLGILEIFHPPSHDLLHVDVWRWIAIHYVQIPLFPLAGVAVAALLRGRTDFFAAACRILMFIFAVCYVAFDTAAGVVVGLLVDAAQKSGNFTAWSPAVDLIWKNPIVGGSPTWPPKFLAVLGTAALIVGVIAAAVSLKLAGRSWGPLILMVISSFGLAIFQTHAWPGGPMTFCGLALAGAWLLWERSAEEQPQSQIADGMESPESILVNS